MTAAELLELQARHEAAHAVVAEDFEWPVIEIVLERKKEVAYGIPSTITGSIDLRHPEPSRENAALFVALSVAGFMAVSQTTSAENVLAFSKDFGLDWIYLRNQMNSFKIEPGHELGAFCEGVILASQVISKHATALEKIVSILIERKRIGGDEIHNIVRQSLQPN